MKMPTKKVLGHSWLGALNYFILQWFFVRLACTVKHGQDEIIAWQILVPVLPLSGWSGHFTVWPRFVPAKRKGLVLWRNAAEYTR